MCFESLLIKYFYRNLSDFKENLRILFKHLRTFLKINKKFDKN